MTRSEPGRVRRVLRHPLLLFLVKIVLVAGPTGLLISVARGTLHWSHEMVTYVAAPVATVLILTLFVLYTRAIEGRAVSELSPHRAPQELSVGFTGGLLCISLVFGVLMLANA